MSLQVYIDSILVLVIKPWLLEKQDFVLEEDDNSGHDKAKNCNPSPDLSLIENCWQLPKQHPKKFSYGDNHITKKLIVEG